jgi:hypothetical protein
MIGIIKESLGNCKNYCVGGYKMEKRNVFSVIKNLVVVIAVLVVVKGAFDNSLNIKVLFLFASLMFFLSVAEKYFSNRKDWIFIVDSMLAIGFLVAFFLF